ncbi:galactosyl transferase GMA12/MNN10 family protein [Mycena rebaudengoi]|nr:galactosyl transferase GMA12/MNN10 family protein [Mycena rebaudengoi]
MHSLSASNRFLVLAAVFLVLLGYFSFPRALQFQEKRTTAHRSKIAKVSVAFNGLHSPTIQRAFETHFKHNALHGYRHFIARQELVDEVVNPDRPTGSWTKPTYVLSVLISELSKPPRERLEWLFWFDADTIIANPYTPLELFLPPELPELPIHFLIASNLDGLNAGVFAVRVHRWSVSLLSAVVAYPIYFTANATTDQYQDQSALSWLLESSSSPELLDSKDHWMSVPMRWFNSLPFNNNWDADSRWVYSMEMTPELFDGGTDEGYEEGQYMAGIRPWKVMKGDMAVHFAGSSGVRDSWMVPWLERVEAMNPEWADKRAKDRLEVEVAKFWQSKVRERREVRDSSGRIV